MTLLTMRQNETVDSSSAETWGWFPALTLTGGLGLLVLALADTGGRTGAWWAYPMLFWGGLLLLFIPTATRLLHTVVSRHERIGLVAILGVELYLVKVLQNPRIFTYSDELVDWRTTNDILTTHRLFAFNPLIPVSAVFPGHEIAMSTLASLTGLPIFWSGILILGIGRLILVVALYLFYETIVSSAKIAALATLLYMSNPNFIFFDSQYSYESFALPFVVLTLYFLVRRTRADDASRVGFTLAGMISLAVIVPTHHMSSYFLGTLLALWALVGAVWRPVMRSNRFSRLFDPPAEDDIPFSTGPGGMTLLAAVTAITWLLYVASATLKYLGPVVGGATGELLRYIARDAQGAKLFTAKTGQVEPLWERAIATLSVAFILLALPFGIMIVWRRYRTNALMIAMILVACTYPATLALRLTASGAETSNRASEFIFLILALILAIRIDQLPLPRIPEWTRRVTAVGWMTVLFMGGLMIGWPIWGRVPGPYLVAADTRSTEAEGLAGTAWVRSMLGPGNRFIADRVNAGLLGSYGEQDPITGPTSNIPTDRLILSPVFGDGERQLLKLANIRYLLVDRRLSLGRPFLGFYFSSGERNKDTPPVSAVDPVILAKLDRSENVDRIFDSGDIIIYDAGAILNAP